MAKTVNLAKKSAPVISYAINLGDVTEMDLETFDVFFNETFDILLLNNPKCSMDVTVSTRYGDMTMKVEDDCDKIQSAVKRALATMAAIEFTIGFALGF